MSEEMLEPLSPAVKMIIAGLRIELDRLHADCWEAYVWLEALQDDWPASTPTGRYRQALCLVRDNLLAMSRGLPRPHGWDTADAEECRPDDEEKE